MGNCIGKKSTLHHKRRRHSPSKKTNSSNLFCNDKRPTKQVPVLLLSSSLSSSSSLSTSPLNTPLERNSIFLSHLSDVKENDIIVNDNDENERKVIQYSSPSLLATMTSTSNEPLVFMHNTLSTLLPGQLSGECKKFKSSNTSIVFDENNIEQAFKLTANEENTAMGHLFSKEKDIDKQNDNGDGGGGSTKVSIDIKVHISDNDQSASHQYFTIINDQMTNRETMIDKREIVQESLNTSPSRSLFDSSLSSLSCNSTPFSSQDRLILSSSPSSSSSAVTSPIAVNAVIIPSPPYSRSNRTNPLTRQNGSRSLTYSEQIYLHNNQSSYICPSNDIFTTLLPASSSRCNNDLFLNEFHQNIISHNCKTLSSIIDNVVQQQFIRIHRSSKAILIEHKELECVHLKDVKKFDTPSLIFDEQQKFVHITKHSRLFGIQSLKYTTNNVTRLPKLFSSCDHCSSLLSGSKLNHRLRPFFLVNTTHNLVQMCFNETNHNTVFGYISQTHPSKTRQTIINNAKFSYSYDLDVSYTSLYFILRVCSWPQELRHIYEQRQRLWPVNIDNLFDGTCFIRVNNDEQYMRATDKCHACEKILSASLDSTWSYTYKVIEAKLVSTMSDEQIRFASIIWNYLNGKTQGQLPFVIFKHTLFYFFEKYSSDSFTSTDVLNHAHRFTDFLFDRLQAKLVPHYFNSTFNLYKDDLSITLMSSISIKMTYLDLKNFSIYSLQKSSLDLYRLIYLVQFETNFLQCLLSCTSSKTNSIQTILDTHELAIKQLLSGIKTYKRQFETTNTIKTRRPLTLDCLYRYQEENVQTVLDYLPLLRDKEPSLLIHSLWSMFIQYFNCLFDDLFIS
ncbi:unnamed protein product [Rotaria socialis]|uniref:Uncharacterized protein n=2 Tax=Rotaria socialis TaxID=392032 RepID=A0A818UEF1_9BILA|nr:unnamed protein product [Rotaria socialis]CAF4214799.1 unnamed protein product [Rotaria socialis]